MLQARATETEIESYLRRQIVEHFGLSPEQHDFAAVAARVNRWFNLAWRDAAELVTIYVRLLDEGVDVWRPVQARPLEGDLFRIVGVDADISNESWQFLPGAIVRCERKRFNDGQIGMSAVECVQTAG